MSQVGNGVGSSLVAGSQPIALQTDSFTMEVQAIVTSAPAVAV
eukprot:COSAG05_NODE_9126_length_645_cov_1.170330_1_plen_42_part_10